MKKILFGTLATVFVLFLALQPGCKDNPTQSYDYNPPGGGGGGGGGNGSTVTIANMAFGPSTLTVAHGTTVTWKNTDGMSHTATSDANSWTTGTIASGASGTVTFNTAGTFTYHCAIHPSMTGTIVVQ